MRRLDWEVSTLSGELGYRILKNYCRLESDIYRPGKIFQMEQNGWPGDWEGRTILALVLHGQVTKREPAFLKEIIEQLPKVMNASGYMGDVVREQEANEQQLSGHNWLLRGLMAYAGWKKDKNVWHMVVTIVEALYKPTLKLYDSYPTEIRGEGGACGSIGKVQNGWQLSTDTGCAFICIDGLAEYYQVTKDPDVELLLREMCRNFWKIDFIGTSMQTHATLSALRGVLRFFEITGEIQFLEQAIRIFGLYQQFGMTANYANQNWFGKPAWTEPCAIVDSYMVAMKLYQLTGELSYLELAHRIYYNALCFAQRYNGGFGCDVCTGKTEEVLKTKTDIFEAYWCCTMRGAEGLTEVVSDTVWQKDGDVIILNQNNIWTNIGEMRLELKTEYPQKGNFKVLACGGVPCSIKVYIPQFALESLCFRENTGENNIVLNGNFLQISYEGISMELTVEFEIPLREESVEYDGKKYLRYWRGEQIVGCLEEGIEGQIAAGMPTETLDKMIDMKGRAESEEYGIRILFPERGRA
ncbi:glycoside hydrolase family 127 protein [Faecalicatena sp. AGMB00832]|uniref:Glycoside hydrolase family 127 protein n=1 Tax=Faecalicatena faecalis TaxID=2726362 RepID=A0ABS6CZW7_9FIRM|nr:beta-L-arabinofuranosidase domain-containing protein [Faecalicatena faecalis]MBU3874526.1 glycoside hydrolase family 127 protein [Faecalicatena faecalis]